MEKGGRNLCADFKWHGEECFSDVLDALGRSNALYEEESEDTDIDEYQTVFARLPGSVAAPTAGLHYDDVLLEDLKKAGLTLSRPSVGAGTFSLSEGEVEEHVMHAERCVLDKSKYCAHNQKSCYRNDYAQNIRKYLLDGCCINQQASILKFYLNGLLVKLTTWACRMRTRGILLRIAA